MFLKLLQLKIRIQQNYSDSMAILLRCYRDSELDTTGLSVELVRRQTERGQVDMLIVDGIRSRGIAGMKAKPKSQLSMP
jgi:hypothetical protein